MNTTVHARAASAASDDLKFHWEILPLVSRTFALTIPQLPEPLDLVTGNAYLWCRLADTIEDEPNLDAKRKRALHQSLLAVLDGDLAASCWSRRVAEYLTEATPKAERELAAGVARIAARPAPVSRAQPTGMEEA